MYYIQGKCRPCYWAEWRRNDGMKKGHIKATDPVSSEGISTVTVARKCTKTKHTFK